LPHVGLRETRNRGTVVGSLVHADPAAELAAVAAALDGVLVLRLGGEERVVAVADFVVAPFMTTKAPGELVTELRLPVSSPRAGWAFHEIERGPFALVAVAAGIELDEEGRVLDSRLAFVGVSAGPVRARDSEAFLRDGEPADSRIDEAIELSLESLDPQSDVLASAAYRLRAARELAGMALRQATERARRAA
jgi:CO/xanthine dehydrogenase FAD-binding subunit